MPDNRKKIKAEYRKRATKSVTVQFYKNTEQPLIEHLEQQPNKSGYIKGLIKEDIEKNKITYITNARSGDITTAIVEYYKEVE